MARRRVRITHRPSGAVIAEGPLGGAITPFEGNLYISARGRVAGRFIPSFIPGLCVYKFLYTWLHYRPPAGPRGESPSPVSHMLGWIYVLPNPLLPWIAFRVAVPREHPELEVVEHAASEVTEDRARASNPEVDAGTAESASAR